MNLTHLLIVLAAIAVYAVFVRVFPTARCRDCNGWGAKAKRKRRAACPRCKGTGRSFRFGARLVHAGHAAAIRYVRQKREGGG